MCSSWALWGPFMWTLGRQLLIFSPKLEHLLGLLTKQNYKDLKRFNVMDISGAYLRFSPKSCKYDFQILLICLWWTLRLDSYQCLGVHLNNKLVRTQLTTYWGFWECRGRCWKSFWIRSHLKEHYRRSFPSSPQLFDSVIITAPNKLRNSVFTSLLVFAQL